MKNRKTIFTALIALLVLMMGVNFDAEAQLGGLLNKAKNKVTGGSKADKEKQRVIDEAKEKFAAQQAMLQLAIPQPDAEKKVCLFSVEGTGLCSWNPATLELTITANRGGNTPGSVYKLDPATGKFTDNNGAPKGSISADGTIESPNLGTLKLNAKIIKREVYYNEFVPNHGIIGLTSFRADCIDSYTVSGTINGKDTKLGSVIVNRAYGSDYIGNVVVNSAVNPLLMAYVTYGLMLSNEGIAAGFVGFDAERKYTMAQLQDMVKWTDASAESKLRKYESSRAFAGFNSIEHPEFKNVKIGAIGLMSEWNETREDNTGHYNGKVKWYNSISYWVIYEFEDGRNIMGRNMYSDVWCEGSSNPERKNYGFYEVTDYQRK